MKGLFLLAILLVAGCATSNGRNFHVGSVEEQANKKIVAQQLKEHYQIAEQNYQSGNLDAAKVEFLVMLDLDSKDEIALYRLGNIAFKQGQYEESAQYFERVIQTNKKNRKAHYNLASIRLMQAENHFKYYIALADLDTDIKKVSRLVADIDSFNSRDVGVQQKSESLEKLAGAIKDNDAGGFPQ